MPRTSSSLAYNVNNKSRAPESKLAHWPQHLRYINSSCFHSSISPSARQFLLGPPSTAKNKSTGDIKAPKITIRVISNPAHPACGQFGLFAAQRIPPTTWIVEYVGQIHCDERPESDYDLSLYRFPDGLSVGIDAATMGNEARFVNDYRGISKKPNAIFVDERTNQGTRFWFLREILVADPLRNPQLRIICIQQSLIPKLLAFELWVFVLSLYPLPGDLPDDGQIERREAYSLYSKYLCMSLLSRPYKLGLLCMTDSMMSLDSVRPFT
ncbi:hypothetical protein BJ912DRAFT_348311 [Pholiota molesta]|nr:hypothetical protein BJ912DRAFT_348311 [Pholiota molesta]